MSKAFYEITEVRSDGLSTNIYRIQPAGGSSFAFKPGQFVKLFFPDGKDFRMFSIASAPSSGTLEFCIKILPNGKFSQVIRAMRTGDRLPVEGPFGHFVYEGQSRCAFVAAGTGIAPIISMLRHIVDQRIPGDFVLLYTNKTEDSILYRAELEDIRRRHPGIRVVPTLTQEVPPHWKGETGRINSDMVARHVPDPSERAWFFCGPVEFVKTIKDYALGKGVQPQHIKMEGWG